MKTTKTRGLIGAGVLNIGISDLGFVWDLDIRIWDFAGGGWRVDWAWLGVYNGTAMIPLMDDTPRRRFPLVTISLICVNLAAFVYELSLDRTGLTRLISTWGATPILFRSEGSAAYPTIFTSMFLHGGWGHIIGNMLYLWIFGDNIEDLLGKFRFVVFYFVCGVIASLSHITVSLLLGRGDLPSIGASGAVAGVLGAYLLLFPRARVLALVPLGFFLRIIRLPALLFLGIWILLQLLSGAASVPGAQGGAGIAFFAHIGGFFAGLILVKPFMVRRRAA